MRDEEKGGEVNEGSASAEDPLKPKEGLNGPPAEVGDGPPADEIPHAPKEGGCGAPEGDEPPEGDGAAVELGDEDWEKSAELGRGEASAREMAPYWEMVRRLERMIAVAGVVVAVAVVWPLGWVVAVCLLLGAGLAWINFRWLAVSVNAIGERIVKAQSEERGAAVVARGVGRICLIALAACVIFTCSVRGLIGFLAGLLMPVVAMMCEAVYEFAASIRRPS